MVLTCIFFISIFTLIMVMQWKAQESLREITALRMEYVKKQYAAEALLWYGIGICKKQYTLLSTVLEKQSGQEALMFNQWPLGGGIFARGVIDIQYDGLFKITATLYEKDVKQVSFSCCLEKQIINPQSLMPEELYMISAWKRDAV